MKRIKDTMKTIVALMSLALICVLGTNADAATNPTKEAQYQPGVTYINPDTTTYKNVAEYYSVKKIRMSTYSDRSFKIIYPKDSTLEVKSPKKAMQVMITKQDNADTTDLDHKTTEAVSVVPTVTEYRYYYWDYAKNAQYELTLDESTGQYYYDKYINVDSAEFDSKGYNDSTERYEFYCKKLDTLVSCDYWDGGSCQYYDKNSLTWKSDKYVIYNLDRYYDDDEDEYYYSYSYFEKTYVTPNYTEPVKATYTDETGTVYTYDDGYYTSNRLYYTADKGFYYYKKINGYKYNNTQKIEYTDKVADYEYAVANVQLTSTKAGTFKVNVFVNGQKTTMTIYVTSDYGYEPYKKVTLNGKTVYSNTIKKTAKNDSYTTVYNHNVKKSLKTAKFKATARKGMKITGIVSTYLNKDGKAIYKKGKNGSKITLSQVYDTDTNYSNGSYSRSTTKNTYVFVSWKDTKLKTSCTYSVVKKNGVKMIKRVEKKADGKKYTSYIEYSNATITGYYDDDKDEYIVTREDPFTLWAY